MIAGTPPGWDEGWEAARLAADPQGALVAVRISAEHRGAYHAITGDQVAMVELRGKLYRAATDKRDLPAVGDFCLVSGWAAAMGHDGSETGEGDTAAPAPAPDKKPSTALPKLRKGGFAIIEAILPRRSLLVRRAAGNVSTPQPLSANVDLAMIVTSANSDLSAQRIDRYLELVHESGIAPLLVVSKLDLAEDPAALLAEVEKMAPGVQVLGTSVPERIGFDRVESAVGPGKTGILIGSSGVGKSSILKALAEDDALVIGEIRARDERGQHTTTMRQLFAMPNGSLWIDTPGMRELAAFAEGDPAIAFPDITALGTGCKFADCHHRREPGCVVRAAVEKNELSAARLASFQKLRGERAEDLKRHTTFTKAAATRAGKRATGKVGARKRPR